MANGNAHDYVRNNDVSPIRLLIGVASGLCYLHAHNPHPIYHGNLRGHNVLISDGGQALLTDFGLSQLLESSFVLENNAPHPRSVNWTSPEHLDDFKGSAEGDVWAFGMTALELFTRSYPFHDIQSSTELKQRIRQGPPDRPSDGAVCSRLTDEWWNILSSCWECNPRLRPSTEEIGRKVVDEQVRAMWLSGSDVLQLFQ
ncbi:hypothetical protein SCLCIDRAFT_460210 [Scleroderma citrinum Foug A]|uniref:Protein kinase domain-containing protein n=1 Tax=Scleroderma citrinum Foug A TaxID=1036808 RepID=A0A0C2ZKG5_9AGAM|nr:hypothetical protein SCLCIDRAFT_460210 [Scleroderma citrinum Foug A]